MTLDLHHAGLIAAREYLENVTTRGFWLSLLLLPIILAVLSVVPVLLSDSASTSGYAVVDHSGWVNDEVQRRVIAEDLDLLFAALQNQATWPDALSGIKLDGSDASEDGADPDARRQLIDRAADLIVEATQGQRLPVDRQTAAERIAGWWVEHGEQVVDVTDQVSIVRFRYQPTPGVDRATLNQRVENDELLGYFTVPDDPVDQAGGARYVTKTLTNLDLQRWYGRHVSEIVRNRRVREQNLPAELADWFERPVNFQPIRITESGSEAEAQVTDTLSQWAPVAFVYMLWISIFSVTQMLLTNTVEEKSNKLVEVLLSSVSALDLMAGKILGIAATGLTIVGSWLLMAIAAASAIPALSGASGIDISGLATNPVYLGSFLLYFLLGYLFYAALLCGLGSLANNLKEAQNLMIPVQLCLFIPLLVMIPIGRDPNGTLAQVMTWLPPFTPFVMMNRAAFPPGEATYLGTTVLMVASIYLMMRIAARVFETGILMTGKPARLTQLYRLLRDRTP